MAVDLRLPNITADTPDIKIEQLKSYMYQLVQELNFALNSLSSEASTSNDSEIMSDYMDAVTIFSSIKYLIMKSNDIINAYYDAIKKKLEDVYVDVSDYQLFVNSINNSITKLNNSTTELNNSINNLKSDSGNLRFSITENNLLHVERKG